MTVVHDTQWNTGGVLCDKSMSIILWNSFLVLRSTKWEENALSIHSAEEKKRPKNEEKKDNI